MADFQPLGALVKTKVLAGDLMATAWVKWLNLIAPRLSSPVTNDAPMTSTSQGNAGNIRYDADYLYVAVGPNQWKRIALTTF